MLQWVSNILNSNTTAARNRKILLLAVFVFSFLLVGNFASAQTNSNLGSEIQVSNEMFRQASGLVDGDIRVIIARIIRQAFAFIGIVFVLIVLYGGFIWMTSGGNDEKIYQAKKIIINGAIGIAIMLSSYSITSFILGRLIAGILGSQGGQGGNNIIINDVNQNFGGSGGLGTVIRDHYPGRGQRNVPRNAKIIITFRRAVVPASFITDHNNNGIFGDCTNTSAPNFNWENDCDTLRLDNNFINVFETNNTSTVIRGATALANPEVGGVFTVVIRPFDVLGSDVNFVPYTVRIGAGVSLDDAANANPSIFAGRQVGRNYYEWSFTCDTTLDRIPPYVTGVFPGNGVTESGNSIIQVNFNKPMDPSNLQGILSTVGGNYVLAGNSVFLRAQNSTLPQGTFRLVNNYQTMEFTPNSPCGQNACGKTVYCMPVCDRVGATCSLENYEILLRAARTFSNTSFEAVPFSGVMDISGNALDGNNNGTVNAVATTGNVFPDQATGDNYYWDYNLNRNLDLTAPYITQTSPGPDATYIAENEPMTIAFSKRLRAETLYNIRIDELPTSPEPLCYVPHASFSSATGTLVTMNHCAFLTASRHYYYPVIDSTVEDSHFNCFYPGVGPTGLSGTTKASTICDSANPTNCCPITGANPLCCNGIANANDRTACLNALKATSPP